MPELSAEGRSLPGEGAILALERGIPLEEEVQLFQGLCDGLGTVQQQFQRAVH